MLTKADRPAQILRLIHLRLGMYLARESDKEFNRIVNVEKYDRWDKTPGGELRKN